MSFVGVFRFLKRKFLKGLVLLNGVSVSSRYEISLLDILRRYLKGIVEGGLTFRAAAVSFNFFMAFFPAIVFLISFIAYVPVDGFQDYLFLLIENVIPPDLFGIADEAIQNVLSVKRGGLLSSGGLLMLIFSANGINSIITGITHSYHKVELHSLVRQYVISVFLALVFCLVVILGIGIIIGGEVLLQNIKPTFDAWGFDYLSLLFLIFRFVIIFALIFLTISIFFYYATSKRSQEWRFFSLGALVASTLFLLASYAFGVYVSDFSQYDKFYGSIGSLLLMLLLIYVNAFVILLGFEIDVSVYSLKDEKILTTLK